MNTGETRLCRRLRISGVLIILGFIAEALSFIWVHALAFLAFMFVSGGLLFAGVITYLYTLVFAGTVTRRQSQ